MAYLFLLCWLLFTAMSSNRSQATLTQGYLTTAAAFASNNIAKISPLNQEHHETLLNHSRRDCQYIEDLTDLGIPGPGFFCDDNPPTMAQMTAHMTDASQQGLVDAAHSVLFYTGFDAATIAHKLDPVSVLHVATTTLERPPFYVKTFSFMNAAWASYIFAQQDKVGETDMQIPGYGRYDKSAFNWCFSGAMAKAAINSDAFLAMPWDLATHAWTTDSTWSLFEYPLLTQNMNIQRIWRIDPRYAAWDPVQCPGLVNVIAYSRPRIVWERSQPDSGPYEVEWECPTERTP